MRQVMGENTDQSEKNALVRAFRRQIERALKEERWRFADYFCDKILAEDPRDLEAWLLKGHLANHRFKDSRTAISCYRQVLVLGAYDSSDTLVAQAREALDGLLERYS